MSDQIREGWETFYKFLWDEFPLIEFEFWLYQSSFVEEMVGRTKYSDLCAFYFQDSRAKEQLQKIIWELCELYNPIEWHKKRVQRVLQQMIDGTLDLVSGCRLLTSMYYSGYDFIPIQFVGFDSELDWIPVPEQYHLWNPEALKTYLRKIDLYRDDIIEASQKLLATVEQDLSN